MLSNRYVIFNTLCQFYSHLLKYRLDMLSNRYVIFNTLCQFYSHLLKYRLDMLSNRYVFKYLCVMILY